jgi:hypothetical protein
MNLKILGWIVVNDLGTFWEMILGILWETC